MNLSLHRLALQALCSYFWKLIATSQNLCDNELHWGETGDSSASLCIVKRPISNGRSGANQLARIRLFMARFSGSLHLLVRNHGVFACNRAKCLSTRAMACSLGVKMERSLGPLYKPLIRTASISHSGSEALLST